MRKTRRSKSVNQLSVLIISAALGITVFPNLLIGAVYFCIKWLDQKLYEHDVNWKEFFEIELKPKFNYLFVLPILFLVYFFNAENLIIIS